VTGWRIGETTTDRNAQLPQTVLFMQQNSVQRALEAGLSSQFQSERRARHEVLRWRTQAAILKRSWSRNFACTVQRSMHAVFLRLATMVRTVGTPPSRTDPPISSEGSFTPRQALHRPGVPPTLAHVVHPAPFLKILSHLPGPLAVGPRS
jgi:hypothetical protein